jgi:hypothetical protein
VCPSVWAREADVERKLNTEVRVLDNSISTMEAHLAKIQLAIRELHNKKDAAGARAMFVQMTNLMKQIGRFQRLHHICSSMLERVKEQAVMATTSVVMQQFVAVHEDLIKDCNLDKLVAQYQELQDNVDGIRSGFDDMAQMSTADPDEPDWDSELSKWLNDDKVVQPPEVTPPSTVVISAAAEAAIDALPVLPSVPVQTSVRDLQALFGKVGVSKSAVLD